MNEKIIKESKTSKKLTNWEIIHRDGANAELYCDGCDFLYNVNRLNRRKDDKWFCVNCSPKNAKESKEPNYEWCSSCSFGTDLKGHGMFGEELIKRRDGHYFHSKCKCLRN